MCHWWHAWPGKSPQAAVIDDLVDFTDMYPTFADAAGVSLGKDDPIDGRSFLPQLLGQSGHPRDFVFLHYQPYWGAQPGQFARTQQYKLYRDGRFFDVPEDLEESNNLHSGNLGVGAAKAKQMLTECLIKHPLPRLNPGAAPRWTDQLTQIGPVLQTNF